METIGDCFMVAGGLVAQDEEGWRTTITHDRLHAVKVLAFAKVRYGHCCCTISYDIVRAALYT